MKQSIVPKSEIGCIIQKPMSDFFGFANILLKRHEESTRHRQAIISLLNH